MFIVGRYPPFASIGCCIVARAIERDLVPWYWICSKQVDNLCQRTLLICDSECVPTVSACKQLHCCFLGVCAGAAFPSVPPPAALYAAPRGPRGPSRQLTEGRDRKRRAEIVFGMPTYTWKGSLSTPDWFSLTEKHSPNTTNQR